MEVSFLKQNEQLMLVVLEGHLEVFDASTLDDQLQSLVNKGYINFVIDLRKIVFMGSTCLKTLIKLYRRTKQVGGVVILVEPENSAIRRVLYITQFDQVFSMYKTVDEALSFFDLSTSQVN